MAVLTKDAIRAAKDWDYDEFDVPKWGGSVRIRALSAGERLVLAKQAGGKDLEGESGFRFFARVICMSVVGPDNELLFDADADFDMLLSKDWNTLQLVAQRIMAFNGMTSEDVKELEKN